MDVVDAYNQNNSGGPPPSYQVAAVTAAPVGGTVMANWGGAAEPVTCPPSFVDLLRGDQILVAVQGNRAWVQTVLVTARQKPDVGTLTGAAGGGLVPVSSPGVPTKNYPYLLTGWTPANGDIVSISWGPSGGIVLGKRSTAGFASSDPGGPVLSYVPPQPPPTSSSGVGSLFYAVDAGSYRSGAWRSDRDVVAQGDYGGYGANSGAFFYGYAPYASIGGATVTAARIYLHRIGGGTYAAQTINLYTHNSPLRPGGDVTRTAGPVSAALAVDQSGWFDIPAFYGQAIVDGGGIGITGSPYVILAGRSDDAGNGAVSLDWYR